MAPTSVLQLKIEIHGANSPYGEVARVFINGTLFTLAFTGLGVLATPMFISSAVVQGGGTNDAILISPFKGVVNRYFSPPVI